MQIFDDCAADLRPREGNLPRILSRGLREDDAQGPVRFSILAEYDA